jgi:hypothetical protein
MSDIADIYRNEMLRAIHGPRAHEANVHDMRRLNQLAQRLADSEEAQSILRAKGHGGAGMTLLAIVREVPNNACGMLRSLFRREPRLTNASPSKPYPSLGEVHDVWSAR